MKGFEQQNLNLRYGIISDKHWGLECERGSYWDTKILIKPQFGDGCHSLVCTNERLERTLVLLRPSDSEKTNISQCFTSVWGLKQVQLFNKQLYYVKTLSALKLNVQQRSSEQHLSCQQSVLTHIYYLSIFSLSSPRELNHIVSNILDCK